MTTSERATVISASQWDTVAEDVKAGRCIVQKETAFGWKNVESVTLLNDGEYLVIVDDPTQDWKEYRSEANGVMRVRWLDTPQPAPATEAAAEAVDKGSVLANNLSHAIDDLGHNNYPEIERQCNMAFQAYRDYTEALESQLTAARNRERELLAAYTITKTALEASLTDYEDGYSVQYIVADHKVIARDALHKSQAALNPAAGEQGGER